MKKKYFLLAPFLLTVALVSAQSISGHWLGELTVKGIKLPLVLHVTEEKDSLKSTLDSPMQGAKDIPVDNTSFINKELRFEIKKLNASYTGILKEDGKSVEGSFSQAGMSLPLNFSKQISEEAIGLKRPQMPKPPFNYAIEEISFTNPADGNTIAGTLTTPNNLKKYPVVVMITGSGPQDRDETLFGHKPFWVIADHFTKNGIGVLRMDDRGVGGSSKSKEDPTSADFATDIDAAVSYLKKRGFEKIGLVGHSEGGMIAPMVVNKNKAVNFMVMMAGPGIPIEDLMALQVYATGKSSGQDEERIVSNVEVSKKIYRLLKNYKGSGLEDSIKSEFQKASALLPDSLLPPANQREAVLNQQVKAIVRPWFQYFIKFNPQDYLCKIKIPVLALNGGLDVQVTPKENLEAIKFALQKAGNRKFEIVEIPGLNHLFQEAKTGAVAEYGQIEQTISPVALDLMTNWILKITKI